MTTYEYKIYEWDRYDDLNPGEVIQQEQDNTWEYFDSIPLHEGRVDLVFRQNTENQ